MPSILTWFGISFAILFVGAHLAVMGGILLEFRRESLIRKQAGSTALAESRQTPGILQLLPSISIVIPARNEERNLEALFESLRGQQYRGALEVVLIDDRSSDATARLFADFAASYTTGKTGGAQRTVKILNLTENHGPNYKQQALTAGLKLACGDYILFTDADCTMEPCWATDMATLLADPRTALAIGPVYKRMAGSCFFDLYQAFDHAVRYMYLVGGTGIGSPCGGFGNNLIVRRSALAAIGGYEAVPYSLTEDAALIACVRTLKGARIRAGLSAGTSVMTTPVGNWRQLVTQGLRWNNGGMYGPDRTTRLVFGALMFSIGAGILVLPIAWLAPDLYLLPIAVYIAMTMDTVATASIAGKALPIGSLRLIPQLLFTPVYFTFLTILGLLRIKISWKDARLPT